MKSIIFVLNLVASVAFAQSVYDIQEKGKSSTWDNARATCQSLGADWDLPTRPQMLEMVISGRSPKLMGPQGVEIFPLWTREEAEADNTPLKGTSVLFYLETDRGYNPQAMDVSLNSVKVAQDRLKDIKYNPGPYLQKMGYEGVMAHIEYLESFIKMTEYGYPVYCVLSF